MLKNSSEPSPGAPRRWPIHIAIVGALVALACSSHKHRTIEDVALESSGRFKEVLQEVVSDPDRSTQAGAVFARYQAQQLSYAADMADLKAAALAKFNAYDTTDEEFDALAAQLKGRREAFRDEISDDLVELMDVLEPGEWTEAINVMLEEEARWKELKQ